MIDTNLDYKIWLQLSKYAWQIRENAYIHGKTKVGAAVYSQTGRFYIGCNVEHIYRCHDIHAEVNAISNMISGGEHKFVAILVVSERERFTPCGGCMDWIMQHGGKDCLIGYQNIEDGEIKVFFAKELMPLYPH
ncbi:MAG: hypothetical protein WC756_10750 [Taibaiella sp.]|jgi:cytidine deaminase